MPLVMRDCYAIKRERGAFSIFRCVVRSTSNNREKVQSTVALLRFFTKRGLGWLGGGLTGAKRLAFARQPPQQTTFIIVSNK